MKKIFSAILIISFVYHPSKVVSFASKCKEPSIVPNTIDFKDTLNGDGWVTQDLGHKTLEIVRYEDIPSLEKNLRKNIVDGYEEMARAWSSKITPQLAKYAGEKASNIILQTGNSEVIKEKLKELELYLKDDSISTEKKTSALVQGTDSAIHQVYRGVGFSVIAGMAAGGLASFFSKRNGENGANSNPTNNEDLLTNSGFNNPLFETNSNELPSYAEYDKFSSPIDPNGLSASSKDLSTRTTDDKSGDLGQAVFQGLTTLVTLHPVALAAVGAATVTFIGYSILSNIKMSNLENKARDKYSKYVQLYNDVLEKIVNHKWIGNNALVMSTTNIPGCDKAQSKFVLIPELNLPITQDIKNDFADVKCKFVERTSMEPWNVDLKKACLDIVSKEIDCLLKNKDDKSCLEIK